MPSAAGDLLELAGHVHLQLLGLDDAGAGDQEERAGEADVESAEFHAGLSSHGLALLRGLVVQRRLDEGVEQRVAVPGRGLELGVELHADEPGVHALRQLDDLGQVLALRQRRDHQAGLAQRPGS
jgi:hypothetical protein